MDHLSFSFKVLNMQKFMSETHVHVISTIKHIPFKAKLFVFCKHNCCDFHPERMPFYMHSTETSSLSN